MVVFNSLYRHRGSQAPHFRATMCVMTSTGGGTGLARPVVVPPDPGVATICYLDSWEGLGFKRHLEFTSNKAECSKRCSNTTSTISSQTNVQQCRIGACGVQLKRPISFLFSPAHRHPPSLGFSAFVWVNPERSAATELLTEVNGERPRRRPLEVKGGMVLNGHSCGLEWS